MRFLGGSRSSTPKDSPKGTPSRFRSRRGKGNRQSGTSSEGAPDAASKNFVITGVRAASFNVPGPVPNRSSTSTTAENAASGARGVQQGGVDGLKSHTEESEEDNGTEVGTDVSIMAGSKQQVKEVPVEPEAVVASSVSMKGLLECGRAMRMDGTFEGQLVSKGSITIGRTGKVTGDLKGLKFLQVEGLVIGDVVCDWVKVLEQGKVFGDISAGALTLGPNTTVKGRITVVKDPSMLKPKPSKTGVGRKGQSDKDKMSKAQKKKPEIPIAKEQTQAPGTGTKSEDRALASTVAIPLTGVVVEKSAAGKPDDGAGAGAGAVYIEAKKAQKPAVKLPRQQTQELEKHAFSDDESQGSEMDGDEEDSSGEDHVRKSTEAIEVKMQQSAGQAPPENIVAKVVAAVEKRGGVGSTASSSDPASPSVKLEKAPLKAVTVETSSQALSKTLSVGDESA